MKVICIEKYSNMIYSFNNFKLIVISTGIIRFYKNSLLHNINGPAIIRFPNVHTNYMFRNKKEWYYNDKYLGSNQVFSNKSWKKYIKELKREERLKIFI